MSARWPNAIVIGASSGIGREIARCLLAQGSRVAVAARRKDRLLQLQEEFADRVSVFPSDVRNYEEIKSTFQEMFASLGKVDLFVYASGVMPAVQLDEFDFEKDRNILETNLLGAVAWLDQISPCMLAQRSGTILGISSVAGDRGRASFPAYSTSKAGLTTFLEALRNRLATGGITVTTVKPGPVRTDMTADHKWKYMMPVETAAKAILKLAPKGGEHYLKLGHKALFWGIRNTPSLLFRRLKL